MNAFAAYPERDGARLVSVETPLLGFIRSEGRGAGDPILRRVARQLMAQGLRVHGVAQVNTERPSGGPCDMDIEVLPMGQQLRISQSLGPGARGCRIDGGALESAVAAVSSGFDAQADLLVINKFGKTEANGGGFRTLIGEAVALGVPVLTSVNAMNLEAFLEFAAGHEIRLPTDQACILQWCKQAGASRLSGSP